MPPTHKNKKWTRTKSSHIYIQVCLLENSKFLLAMTPEVCVSLLRNSYSLSLRKTGKPTSLILNSVGVERGKKSSFTKWTESAQKSVWSSPTRSTGPLCLERTFSFSKWEYLMPKPLTVWITINCGKFWKSWEYQTTWPAFWDTCMQVRKQQLELDMEQQTGSK